MILNFILLLINVRVKLFVGFIIFDLLSRLGDYTSQITCSTISSHTKLSQAKNNIHLGGEQ